MHRIQLFMEITLIYLKYFCVNFVPWWIFSNCHIKKRSIIAREQVAAKRLKSFWQRKKDETVDVATKIDGTWQKRHDHNPKLDVTFTISADNGEELIMKSWFPIAKSSSATQEIITAIKNISVHQILLGGSLPISWKP